MRSEVFAPLGRPISKLVMGVNKLRPGNLEYSDMMLGAWLDMGGTTVDTAHIYGDDYGNREYGDGSAERGLGVWFEHSGRRGDVVVITKGGASNVDRHRVTPEDIACDLRDSLVRLRTSYIDIYLLHRDDPNVDVGTIVEALNDHLDAGRIRAFGASNWTVDRLQAAAEYAKKRGLTGFALSSVQLSLAEPTEAPWPDAVSAHSPVDREWYRVSQMPLFPWSSQARGFFTGLHTRENPPNRQDGRVYSSGSNWARLERARQIASRMGFTAQQIALAWVLHQPFPVFPIIGPKTVEQLTASASSLDVRLTAAELAYLENG